MKEEKWHRGDRGSQDLGVPNTHIHTHTHTHMHLPVVPGVALHVSEAPLGIMEVVHHLTRSVLGHHQSSALIE